MLAPSKRPCPRQRAQPSHQPEHDPRRRRASHPVPHRQRDGPQPIHKQEHLPMTAIVLDARREACPEDEGRKEAEGDVDEERHRRRSLCGCSGSAPYPRNRTPPESFPCSSASLLTSMASHVFSMARAFRNCPRSKRRRKSSTVSSSVRRERIFWISMRMGFPLACTRNFLVRSTSLSKSPPV